MPASSKIHPVFHVPVLEPVTQNPLRRSIQPPPPAVILDNKEEFDVEEILDPQKRCCTLQYFVR